MNINDLPTLISNLKTKKLRKELRKAFNLVEKEESAEGIN
jgi:hypothetical protein